jgi:hypothetical protein
VRELRCAPGVIDDFLNLKLGAKRLHVLAYRIKVDLRAGGRDQVALRDPLAVGRLICGCFGCRVLGQIVVAEGVVMGLAVLLPRE